MTRSRTAVLVLLLLVPPGATAVAAHLQRYPRRFAEVIPGRLYRGGFPSGRHIRNLWHDKNIKMIISLTDVKDESKYHEEEQTIQELGLRFERIAMPGDGCAAFGDLDRAADALTTALADKDRWPVFFHCGAGKQRTNAVLAAYRMKACGWTLSQGLAELEYDYGLDRGAEKVLVDHLREYADRLDASGHRTQPRGA